MPDDPADQPPADQPESPPEKQPESPPEKQPDKQPVQPKQSRHERRMQRLQERKAEREQGKEHWEAGQKRKKTLNRIIPPIVGLLVAGLLYGAYSIMSTPASGPADFYGLKLPKVGDHWHATYEVTLCGERMPVFGEPPLGDMSHSIHSHNDGIIHLEVASPAFAGPVANLKAFFTVYGVTLTNSSISYPGGMAYANGGNCPNSTAPGRLQLLMNNREHELAERYVPQDGDTVRVVFG